MNVEKLYYSMSEAAEILKQPASTVRFWSNSFPDYIKPKRNAKGNRQFTRKDLDVMERISYLTKDCGLSLEAVARKLSKGGDDGDKSLEIRDSLLKIREQLVQIRESL